MNSAVALSLALSVSAPGLKELPLRADEIVGEWLIESSTFSGSTKSWTDDEVSYVFSADGSWSICRGRIVDQVFTFKVIDPGVKPAQLNLQSPNSNPPGQYFKAIFQIEKDRMSIAQARRALDDRPTKFESPKGSETVLYILKRVKPKKG